MGATMTHKKVLIRCSGISLAVEVNTSWGLDHIIIIMTAYPVRKSSKSLEIRTSEIMMRV